MWIGDVSILRTRVPIFQESIVQPSSNVDDKEAGPSIIPWTEGISSQSNGKTSRWEGTKRIRWSRWMNIEIIRSYYRINIIRLLLLLIIIIGLDPALSNIREGEYYKKHIRLHVFVWSQSSLLFGNVIICQGL